jgi:uncharacterized protein (DUF2141 family)
MKRVMLIGLSILLLAHSKAQTSADPKGKIEVVINNFRNSKGSVYVILFNKPDGFPDANKGFKIMNKKIINKVSSVEFDNLPQGEYAISVFHDENDNKVLDRNFLGIPKEGVGASNNAKGHFGPPKYRDAKFYLKNEVKTISISITYL